MMSDKSKRPYADKHDPNIPLDSTIEQELKKRAESGEISCVLAFKIADDLQVRPEEVGRTADVLEMPIIKCQLGLFGYKPDKKIVKAEDTDNQQIKDAILGSSKDNKLSCEKAWEIADQFKMSRLKLSNVCQANLIKIGSCKLGAF